MAATHLDKACAYCEHFDGGGEHKVKKAIEIGVAIGGDCLCSWGSPRFETRSDQSCRMFTVSSSQWAREAIT